MKIETVCKCGGSEQAQITWDQLKADAEGAKRLTQCSVLSIF